MYLTLAEVNQYHTDRNNTLWVGDDVAKNAAMLYAQDYINSLSYKGQIAETTQADAFPRINLYDNDGRLVEGIPQGVKNALAEISLIQLTNGATTTVASSPVIREKVDVVEVEYARDYKSTGSPIVKYPHINALLKPYLANQTAMLMRG